MRWKTASSGLAPRFHWHSWFAWYPVVVDKEWIWLEFVFRKRFWDWEDYAWEYALAIPKITA